MAKEYKAENIRVLEGLDAVRLRPGMYIGTTGIKGLHHILWEIVDNSMDEISNGHGDTITVRLYKDGSASVEDNGRGIPTDIHPTQKVSGVEVVFTQLHAGGKFDGSNYAFSGGLHGVGASVTNALSRWLHVEVYKDKKIYAMDFESKEVKGAVKSGMVKTHLEEVGKTKKTGTFVRFFPDDRVFESIIFNVETISRRLRELAYLNKGVHIILEDERVETDEGILHREFCFEGGIVDYVLYLNESKEKKTKPIYIEGEKDGIYLEAALQYTDAYTENVFSYVNNIPTSDGGTHETGFKSGMTKVLNDIARSTGVLKEKDENLLGEDYREGLTCVLSIKMNNVQFEGQTKGKLGNPEAKTACDAITAAKLEAFLVKNKAITDEILKKALQAAKVREEARKAKDIARQKNSIENFNTIGKLKNCTGKKPELNELYIVEGNSAGGTCTQARNRAYQAILPLRGKPLNAEKKRIDQVLANEEIRTIVSALGAGIGDTFNVENLKYHKVVILSDADQDGMHIRCILLTFFYRYMRELITQGHVYIGMPPLYRISKRDKTEYLYTDQELEIKKKEYGKAEIQRYKGLGEMNAEQLWATTLDPERRSMIQVTIEEAAEAELLVSTLMGDTVELRKNYIIKHANFNKQDNFNAD